MLLNSFGEKLRCFSIAKLLVRQHRKWDYFWNRKNVKEISNCWNCIYPPFNHLLFTFFIGIVFLTTQLWSCDPHFFFFFQCKEIMVYQLHNKWPNRLRYCSIIHQKVALFKLHWTECMIVLFCLYSYFTWKYCGFYFFALSYILSLRWKKKWGRGTCFTCKRF